MQSNFPACLAFTLAFEGGRVDDPRDPGGRTNQGVTQTTYNAFRRGRGQAVTSVYNMTDAERDAIYAAGFWDSVGAAALPIGVDLAVFDYGVNSGPARALKAKPAATMAPDAAVRAVCAARTSFLRGLKTWASFGKGWARRVAACEALGVRMALEAAGAAPHVVAGTLDRQADATRKSAATHKSIATASGSATAAGPIAATQHVSWIVPVAIAVVALAVAAYFAWRAMHNSARAEAYAAESKR